MTHSILKKVTPIIYKDTKTVPYPVPYPMQSYGGGEQGYGGGMEGYGRRGGEGGGQAR